MVLYILLLSFFTFILIVIISSYLILDSTVAIGFYKMIFHLTGIYKVLITIHKRLRSAMMIQTDSFFFLTYFYFSVCTVFISWINTGCVISLTNYSSKRVFHYEQYNGFNWFEDHKTTKFVRCIYYNEFLTVLRKTIRKMILLIYNNKPP